MPTKTIKKTLFTPVFFSSSEPPRGSKSSTSLNLKVPSAYLKSLSRTHIALAQIVQEEPSSRPGSPTEDAGGSYPDLSTQQRVSALRARVKEAWDMADGNPADGKWTLLSQILRIGVTSGKAGRWVDTRADLKVPDAPDGGWINAATEAEWAEWEKRVRLKDTVENWKMGLETHEKLDSQIIKGTGNPATVEKRKKKKFVKDTQQTPNTEPSEHQDEEAKTADGNQVISVVDQVARPTSSTVKVAGPTPILAAQPSLTLKAPIPEGIASTNSNPLKDNSLFGFAVVKRSNPSAVASGKKPQVDANPPPNDSGTGPPIRKIVDIPETSFFPPPFPSSQINASTPNAKPIFSDKHNPEPIPFTASPPSTPINDPVPISSPLSSPRVTKVYGRSRQDPILEKSTSLPAIPSVTASLPAFPSTPTRNINDNNKRPFYSPDHSVKKARTMPSPDSSPIADGSPRLGTVFQPSTPKEDKTNSPLPTTPKRQNLPTFTELLASAKKGKKKLHSQKSLKPKSAVGAGVDSSTKTTSKIRFPSHPPATLEDNPYVLDPYAISVNHEIDLSPAKSLSSLAGSDSEDEDEDEDDELKQQAPGSDLSPSSFNPFATSTQHQNYTHERRKEGSFITSPRSSGDNGRVTGLSLDFFGGYNSQFDVAGQVDKVDKLLERDVDYEGWLRDPSSLEGEGARVEESP